MNCAVVLNRLSMKVIKKLHLKVIDFIFIFSCIL